MQKLLTFFSKNISIYAIFNDQRFNNKLTNDIVNFEQIGPGYGVARKLSYRILSNYHTYPYKCTVKRFHILQITASVTLLFVYFIKAYVDLNCIDFYPQHMLL